VLHTYTHVNIQFVFELIDQYIHLGDKKLYQRYRFVPMVMGLKVYKHLFGFPMPHYNFVVPDEPQWPYWMVSTHSYMYVYIYLYAHLNIFIYAYVHTHKFIFV
jgi:hypothetical protein